MAKMRVYQLAKELQVQSALILELLDRASRRSEKASAEGDSGESDGELSDDPEQAAHFRRCDAILFGRTT